MDANDLAVQLLRSRLQQQPLVKRYANTATTAVGLVVAVLWTLISAGVDVSENVMAGGLVLVSLGTMIGVRFTPNGVTDKQVRELEEHVGRHRRAQ